MTQHEQGADAVQGRRLAVGSLFSGVEGLGLGFERAGASVTWQVEIAADCRSVLARHFPNTRQHDDVRSVHGEQHCPSGGCDGCLAAVDVLVGGFPCQDLSVAGRRAGLGGERSGLWWELYRLVAELAPVWVVIENVPGLLSAVCADPDTGVNVPGGACPGGCMAAHGGAMGTLLGAVGGLGYGFAYRVLDAQNFGLAQRRNRVFVVLRAGADFAGPAEVLLEPEGGGRCAPSGDAEGQEVAGPLGGGAPGRGWSDDLERAGAFVAVGFSTQGTEGEGTCYGDLAAPVTGSHGDGMVAHALLASGSRIDAESETFIPYRKSRRAQTNTDDESWVEADVANTLNVHDTGDTRATEIVIGFDAQAAGDGHPVTGDWSRTLGTNGRHDGVYVDARVRRLVPVERERLQGFPDDWTRWGHDGREMSVAARERMTGNAVPVNVAEWIARRVIAVHAEKELAHA